MAQVAMDPPRPASQRRMETAERQVGVLGVFGAFCFLAVAIYVDLLGRVGLDAVLQEALRIAAGWADPFRDHWVEQAARDLAPAGGPTILGLVVAVATAHVVLSRGWGAATLLLAALAGGLLAGAFLKIGFGRLGSLFTPQWLQIFGASFPSAGALASAIIYPTLGAALAAIYRRRLVGAFLIACALLATLLVGLSRALLHIHLPTDVLAGWSAGLAWASLCWIVIRRIRNWGRLD
jgi:undecaprenyl-diphosphatase